METYIIGSDRKCRRGSVDGQRDEVRRVPAAKSILDKDGPKAAVSIRQAGQVPRIDRPSVINTRRARASRESGQVGVLPAGERIAIGVIPIIPGRVCLQVCDGYPQGIAGAGDVFWGGEGGMLFQQDAGKGGIPHGTGSVGCGENDLIGSGCRIGMFDRLLINAQGQGVAIPEIPVPADPLCRRLRESDQPAGIVAGIDRAPYFRKGGKDLQCIFFYEGIAADTVADNQRNRIGAVSRIPVCRAGDRGYRAIVAEVPGPAADGSLGLVDEPDEVIAADRGAGADRKIGNGFLIHVDGAVFGDSLAAAGRCVAEVYDIGAGGREDMDRFGIRGMAAISEIPVILTDGIARAAGGKGDRKTRAGATIGAGVHISDKYKYLGFKGIDRLAERCAASGTVRDRELRVIIAFGRIGIGGRLYRRCGGGVCGIELPLPANGRGAGVFEIDRHRRSAIPFGDDIEIFQAGGGLDRYRFGDRLGAGPIGIREGDGMCAGGSEASIIG